MIEVSSKKSYPPEEDTFLLLSAIENEKGDLLEIGTGSGYIAISYKLKNPEAEVWAVDIDESALEEAKENAKRNNASIIFKLSDVFENIDRKFDVIVFNPPYLPPDEMPPDNALIDNGSLEKFINEVKKYLKEGGRAYVLVSSLTPNLEILEKRGWKKIKEKSLFFEKLFVYRLVNE